MSAITRAMYKPLSIATSVAGGLLAGPVFNQVWQRLSDTDQQPPDPNRAGPRGYRAVTHESPM
jgi:Protein of unknown function (DUF4235)